MKVHIISFVPVQIPYLGKFWFLSCKPKYSQLIRLQDPEFKKKVMYQSNFWYDEINLKNIKDGLQI